MFNQSTDDRLSAWAKHRLCLESSKEPFQETWDFWKSAPFTPYNNKIDPYYQDAWPNPWEIIVHNRYDDFTKSLMIAYSLKLTKRFSNSQINIKILLDNEQKIRYNSVNADYHWFINYRDDGPVFIETLPQTILLENTIEIKSVR